MKLLLLFFFNFLFHSLLMAINPENVTATPFLDSLENDDRFTEWAKNLRVIIRSDDEFELIDIDDIKVYALGGTMKGCNRKRGRDLLKPYKEFNAKCDAFDVHTAINFALFMNKIRKRLHKTPDNVVEKAAELAFLEALLGGTMVEFKKPLSRDNLEDDSD